MTNQQWKRVRLIVAAALTYVLGFGAMWNHLPETGPRCDPNTVHAEFRECSHARDNRMGAQIFGSLLWPVVAPFVVAIRLTGGDE